MRAAVLSHLNDTVDVYSNTGRDVDLKATFALTEADVPARVEDDVSMFYFVAGIEFSQPEKAVHLIDENDLVVGDGIDCGDGVVRPILYLLADTHRGVRYASAGV